MGDLLLDGVAKIAQRRKAEPIHVEQEVVKVEPLRPMRRTRRMDGSASGVRKRTMVLERLPVVFVPWAVVGAAGGTYERGIQVGHRVVLGIVPRGARVGRNVGNLAA
jgi:hypothetical protein